MHIYFLCLLRVSTAMYWWYCRSMIIVAPTQVHCNKLLCPTFLIILSDNILITFTLNHIEILIMKARNDANINLVWVRSYWIGIDISLNAWSIDTMTRKRHWLKILPGLFETSKPIIVRHCQQNEKKIVFIQKIEKT